MFELEPLSFDRALQSAADALERRIAKGAPIAEALPPDLSDDETLAWLRELGPKDPLAGSLELWLLRLREQSELAARRTEIGRAHRAALHSIQKPADERLPLAHMFQRALARPLERSLYLKGYLSSAGDLAELIVRLWEERQQFAERVKAPLASFEVVSPELLPAARNFLNETRAAYETLEIEDAAAFVTAALAETAHEGWPAHLSARTVSELTDRAWWEGLSVRPFPLPRAYGGASFALALSELGRAVSDAASAPRAPFVLARDVFDLRRHELGALFGGLPLSAAFATKQLGLGGSRTRDFLRPLARAALVDARVAAFRVLLRELLLSGQRTLKREFPELAHAALGCELPPEIAGAFVRVRPRDSQRFAATLHAATQHEQLILLDDEDWFRNPRVIRRLREELSVQRATPNQETLTEGSKAFRARIEALL